MRTAEQILIYKLIDNNIVLNDDIKNFILSCIDEALIEGIEVDLLENCPFGYEPKFCDHPSVICEYCKNRKLSN